MITFKIERDGATFHAWSPELPGCHTHGATRADALRNLKDAVNLYLEDVMEEALLSTQVRRPKARANGRRRAKAA